MSSSGEEEPEYDVERILAEKYNEDGKVVYLVKWQNYPDEECSWEPREMFNTPASLSVWEEQKASGDTLDEIDVERIQQQMDDFQAGQAEPTDDEEEAAEPPRKRVKMAPHNPDGRRPKKGIASGSKRRTNVSAPPLHRPAVPRPKKLAITRTIPLVTEKPLLSTRATPAKVASVTSSTTGQGSLLQTATAARRVVSHFHAPDLSQRTRVAPISGNQSQQNLSGKSFRNLQHQNNARKKLRDAVLLTTPSVNTSTIPTEAPALDTTVPTGNSDEPNDWRLFFSSDEEEEGESKRRIKEQILTTTQAISAGLSSEDTPATLVAAATTQTPAPPAAITPTTPGPLDCLEDAVRQINTSQSTVDRRSADRAALMSPQIDISGAATHQAVGPVSHKKIPTQSSTQEIILVQKEPNNTTQPRSNNLDGAAAPTHIVPLNTRLAADIPRRSPSRSAPRTSSTVVAKLHPTPASTPTLDYYNPVGPMSTSRAGGTTRQWYKGDIIIELILNHREVGGVKLLHIPWQQGTKLIFLKQGHRLPIYFDRVITRAEYELKSQPWFTWLALGSVEPFTDSIPNMNSLSVHLEEHNVAALWDHPSEDLLLIMYSCKSSGWQDFGQKPIREGPSRVHIAFRQRLRQPVASIDLGKKNTTVSEELIDKVQHETIEPREDARRGRRSRRNSELAVNVEEQPMAQVRSLSHEDTPNHPVSQRQQVIDDPRLHKRTPSRQATVASNAAFLVRSVQASAKVATKVNELPQGIDITSPRQQDVHANNKSVDGHASRPFITSPVVTKFNQSESRKSPVQSRPTTPLTCRSLSIDGTASNFAGLDRAVKDLYESSVQQIDTKDIRVLIVYTAASSERVQQLEQWLVNGGIPADRMLHKQFDSRESAKSTTWRSFLKLVLGEYPSVLICDVRCRFGFFEGLAKALDQENLWCWQVDLATPGDQLIPVKKLFPSGIAVTFSERSIIYQPEAAMFVMEWFRGKVKKPFSASRLVFPPKIIEAILDEAKATEGYAREQYFELAKILQELKMLAYLASNESESELTNPEYSECNPILRGFSIVEPGWSEVYEGIPEKVGKLSRLEQERRESEKDGKILSYFGSWATRNVANHRRFMAFTHDKKADDQEHVRFLQPKTFQEGRVKATAAAGKEKDRARGRSRSRPSSSKERSRSRPPVVSGH